MANSNRVYKDANGNMFMPMNVEGGTWDEHFISTGKLITIGVIFFSLLFIILFAVDSRMEFTGVLVLVLLWIVISQFAIRYIVFEEKFYYKMYKKLKECEITTPAVFWDIASIRDTADGAIMTYSDTKIGIIVKLERDTITGKHPSFKETHYDAISDFYKEISLYKYKFVQMNIMEQAGNDPRLANLDPLIHKSNNENICNLMEKEIGYIKNITHKTLYESDYILIYTSDLTKLDSIINDTIECIYKIMEGAYIGYRILSSREIIELVKEEYGTKYFNYTQATLDMYKLNGVRTIRPFSITGIIYTDGTKQDLGNVEINKLRSMTSGVLSGARKINDIAIRDTLKTEKRKEFDGVDLGQVAQGFAFEPTPNNGRQVMRPGKGRKPNNRAQNYEPNFETPVAEQEFSDYEQYEGYQDPNDIYYDESDGGYSQGNGYDQGNEYYEQPNNGNNNNQRYDYTDDSDETIDF